MKTIRTMSLSRLAVVVTCILSSSLGTLAAQTPTWLDASPLPLGGIAAHRPDRGTTIVVDGVQNRLWEWDGATFRRLLGAAPTTTNVGVATWDASRRRFVFGRGFTWDGANWNNLPMPSGVTQFGALAFDATRQRLVGLVGTDVHEWDGLAWTRITPPASPGEGYGLVFDAQRGRCVLAAGQTPALFDWDGAQWNVVDASLPSQGPYFVAGIEYDPVHARLVLHGMVNGMSAVTWQFQAGAWQSIATPSGFTSSTRLTFDGIGLLRMGTGAFPREGLWRLEGNLWRQLPLPHPPARTLSTVASSPTIAGAWMFGGRTSNSAYLSDLWRFDGSWTAIPSANGPSPRSGAAMAWSPTNQAFLLHGGADAQSYNLDDTWLWNGSTWQQQAPSTTPGELLRLATDPSGGVFGLSASPGNTAQRWLWNGSDWSSAPAPSTFAWSSNDAAYHPIRNVVVATGTYALAEWNGAAWTQGPSTNQYGSRIAFRPDTGKMLISDGSATVEWDGTALSNVTGGSAVAFATAAPDFARGLLWGLRGTSSSSTNAFAAYLTPAPHRAERLAYGCSLAGSPGIVGEGVPAPGNAGFGIRAETLASYAPAAIALGFALQGTNLGGGCVVWLQSPPATFVALTDASGRTRMPLPLPNDPNLLGVAVLAQAGAVDPAHSPIGSIVVSDVLRITLGD
jgi:hypothetical protein